MHDVLRLLDERGLELDTNLRRMLAILPQIDWGEVHALADRISARNNSKDYETMLAMIEDWLDAQVRGGARDHCRSILRAGLHPTRLYGKNWPRRRVRPKRSISTSGRSFSPFSPIWRRPRELSYPEQDRSGAVFGGHAKL